MFNDELQADKTLTGIWHFTSKDLLLTVIIFCQIFGGVGIACLPLGLIFSFIRRPKAVITRSQYIKVFFIM